MRFKLAFENIYIVNFSDFTSNVIPKYWSSDIGGSPSENFFNVSHLKLQRVAFIEVMLTVFLLVIRFSGGSRRGVRQSIIWFNFYQKLHEMKEFGPRGSLNVLLDPPPRTLKHSEA